MTNKKTTFTFIDLFCGIGGFHQALEKLGGKCVFACDINPDSRSVYKENYNIEPFGDINNIELNKIKKHDVLCAGFPCQSFSKAGQRKGFNDERGNLFFSIIRILKNQIKRNGGPNFLLLENVRDLVSHDKGNTWKRIYNELKNLGYNIVKTPVVVGPNDFGVPQLRERAIILGVKSSIFDGDIKLKINKKPKNSLSYTSIIQHELEVDFDKYKCSTYEMHVLNVWNEFINNIKFEKIGFPIWVDYFKYSYKDNINLPGRKKEIIDKNKNLYITNKAFIDKWLTKNNYLKDFKISHRKFEWQVDKKITNIFDGIIQFRPSGVRIKQPTEIPTLVAMVQIPIIGPLKRRLTPRECANLQSFDKKFIIHKDDRVAYKQFGNAVNVKVINNVFKMFVESIGKEDLLWKT